MPLKPFITRKLLPIEATSSPLDRKLPALCVRPCDAPSPSLTLLCQAQACIRFQHKGKGMIIVASHPWQKNVLQAHR